MQYGPMPMNSAMAMPMMTMPAMQGFQIQMSWQPSQPAWSQPNPAAAMSMMPEWCYPSGPQAQIHPGLSDVHGLIQELDFDGDGEISFFEAFPDAQSMAFHQLQENVRFFDTMDVRRNGLHNAAEIYSNILLFDMDGDYQLNEQEALRSYDVMNQYPDFVRHRMGYIIQQEGLETSPQSQHRRSIGQPQGWWY